MRGERLEPWGIPRVRTLLFPVERRGRPMRWRSSRKAGSLSAAGSWASASSILTWPKKPPKPCAQRMRQPLVAHRGDQVDRVIAADSAPVGERASGLHEFHVEGDRIDHSALHNPVAHRGDVEGARTTFGFRHRHCDEGLGQVGAHAQSTGQFLYESVGIPHDRSALRRDVAVAGVPGEQVVPCSLQRLPGCCAVVDGVGVLRAPVIREVSTSVEHAPKRVQSDADEPIRRRLPRAPPDGGACHGSACRFRCSHDRSSSSSARLHGTAIYMSGNHSTENPVL